MFKTAVALYGVLLFSLFILAGCTLWLDVEEKELLITSERIENDKKTQEKKEQQKKKKIQEHFFILRSQEEAMKCKAPFFVKDYKILVPCGKCLSCRITKRHVWTGRILMELQSHPYATFLTLTYNDENLPSPPHLSKRELQLFFKRLRKNFNSKLRYFACGEYGEGRGRPHYHAIVFGMSERDPAHVEIINKSWTLGFVYFGSCTPQSAGYVAGYVAKKKGKDDDTRPKEFTLMSRRPALGSGFLKYLADGAFLQHPYDVLSVIRVGGKNYPLDRTIRTKLRELVMTPEEIDHIKKIRVALLKEELCELIAEQLGREYVLKFKAPSDAQQWDAYLAGFAYEKAYFEKIDEKERFIASRSFRKDL